MIRRIVCGVLACVAFYITSRAIFKVELLTQTSNYGRSAANTKDSHCVETCTQQERQQYLQEQCSKYPELQETFNDEDPLTYGRLLVDDKHKVLYCALPKAASTTFYNLFYLAVTGQVLDDIHCRPCWQQAGLVWLSTLPKEERDKRLRDYFKIMVVRHPMDRLESCWNGKFTRPYSHATWRDHGPKMIEMFRTIPENSTLQDEIKRGATFEEFVKYVGFLDGSTQEHNTHWNTHYRLCHPCSIPYDHIVKVETLEQDAEPILARLNLAHVPTLNIRRSTENSTLSKTLANYSRIQRDLLSQITTMYSPDMDLFGYNFNEDTLTVTCGNEDCSSPHCC